MMMAQDPRLIRALAEYFCRLYSTNAGWNIQVKSVTTLNGRPSQYLTDTNVNFAKPIRTAWIIPLQEPLSSQAHRQGDINR
jgi:hypothetical protein